MVFVGAATGASLLGAGLIGAGSIASGVLGYEGSKDAANAQAQSAANALAFQKQTYADNQPRINAASTGFDNAQTTANNSFAPWMNTGASANYTLGQLLGTGNGGQTNQMPDYTSFFNSPDYQFAQQQGQKGVINAANAQGVGLSGGTLKDLASFNSGLATQQYGNYFSRLMSLSQMGANAASGLATTTSNIAGGRANLATGAANANNAGATSIGNTTQAVGAANASGIVGGTNAITGGINSGVSNSLLYNALQKQNNTAYNVNNPSYGGGNSNSGDSFGGTSSNPLAGLTSNDYGMGF